MARENFVISASRLCWQTYYICFSIFWMMPSDCIVYKGGTGKPISRKHFLLKLGEELIKVLKALQLSNILSVSS